jgi:hypothetical protein
MAFCGRSGFEGGGLSSPQQRRRIKAVAFSQFPNLNSRQLALAPYEAIGQRGIDPEELRKVARLFPALREHQAQQLRAARPVDGKLRVFPLFIEIAQQVEVVVLLVPLCQPTIPSGRSPQNPPPTPLTMA